MRALDRRIVSPTIAGGVVIAVLFMGSTLLTPLYSIYRDLYGFGALELTLIYAVYVIGNLTALLFFGRLSDQFGRRPLVVAGLALAAISASFFFLASSPAALFIGRIGSGLSVGLGSGTASAWITESLPEERRPLAASVMTAYNYVGLALGPVLGGLLVQYAPDPLHLPFIAYGCCVGATVALALMAPETLDRHHRSPFTVRPRFGVPVGKRLEFVPVAATGFATMAVVGFYAALGPTMIHKVFRVDNHAVGGLIIAEMFAVAAVAIFATRSLPPGRALILGLASLPVALGLLVAAESARSLSLMLVGTTLSGAAAGLGYRSGLSTTNVLAPPDRRAEVVSVYLACCFIGNAVPVIGVGALSESWGLTPAANVFAVLLSLVAIGALGLACLGKNGSSWRASRPN